MTAVSDPATTSGDEGATPKDGANDGREPKDPAATDGANTPSEPDNDPLKDFDPERAMNTIKRQREAEKAALERAKVAEAKVAEFEREKMSEQERVQSDLDKAQQVAADATAELRAMRVEQAFSTRALSEGLNPKAIKAALATAQLDVDENGQVANLDDAIGALKSEHPYLFAAQQRQVASPGNPNAGAGTTPPSDDANGPVLNETQAEAADRLGLSHEEYAKYMDQ